MRLITIAGPPSSGKTSVLTKVIEELKEEKEIGVVKFDCLTTADDQIYQEKGIKVKVGLSAGLCPDHFFVTNIESALDWGKRENLEYLFTESAGLCNRCSPHIQGVFAVCVIDNLSGINTPNKIGPMLKFADLIVITKSEIVSQAEREVFAYQVRMANKRAKIIQVNGITGQGALELSHLLQEAAEIDTLEHKRLRFTMPAALCSYCLGEREIGKDFQLGNVQTMDWR